MPKQASWLPEDRIRLQLLETRKQDIPRYKRLLNTFGATNADDMPKELHDMAIPLQHAILFARHGHIFRASRELMHRLSETEIRGLSEVEIYIPYPVCSFRYELDSLWRTTHIVSKEAWPGKHPREENTNNVLAYLYTTVDGHPNSATGVIKKTLPDKLPAGDWRITKLLLYLASTDVRREIKFYDQSVPDLLAKRAAAKTKSQHKRLTEILGTKNRKTYTYIGGGLPSLKQTASAKGVPLAVRTLVRGHFRNQPCGVGRSDSKLIWVQPFWRGPLGGEVSTKEKRVT